MTAARQDDDALVGRAFGEFVLREKIGRGGFGAVYRARQPALDREAVVKVLHPHLRAPMSPAGEGGTSAPRATTTATSRFLREAKLASSLDHPYAAHIYAFGAEPDGELWIAMELVRGTPLDQILKLHGPIPLERFVPLLDRICEVVHTAHEQGIVHRDLKPANVMVLARAGRLLPKLLDFGIAKGAAQGLATTDTAAADPYAVHALPPSDLPWMMTVNDGITQRGAVIGSPLYMAPEQWIDATHVDLHTDLYALGVLAYEAVTGAPPFIGESVSAIAQAHRSQWPAPVGPKLPAALDAVFAKALAKQPDRRYADALAFGAAFRRAAGAVAETVTLPAIDPARSELAIASAPQPIAEAAAAVEAARNAHQARDAVAQLARTIARYLGLIALACRSRFARGSDAPSVTDAMRTLYRRPLAEREWLELARELTRVWIDRRDAYPIPELVDLFHGESAPRPPPPAVERGHATRDLGPRKPGDSTARPAGEPSASRDGERSAANVDAGMAGRDAARGAIEGSAAIETATSQRGGSVAPDADRPGGPGDVAGAIADRYRGPTVDDTAGAIAGDDRKRGRHASRGAAVVDDIVALAALRGADATTETALVQALEDAVKRASRVLAAIGFTSEYPLVVTVAGGLAERWMGVRRAQRTTMAVRGKELATGVAALLDDDGVPVLSLAPLVQVAAPTPGAPLDLFLFDGRDRRGAKLVALPAGFEHHDDALWDWFRAQLTGSFDEAETATAEERPPYRGLQAFSAEDGPVFFGREKLVDAVANRLRVQPLLAVVGRSGAGKSSFVHAGVLPALGTSWRAISMRPGSSPIAALASKLGAPDLRASLDRDRGALGDLLRADAVVRGPLVLVVDQLEEMFTLCDDADERCVFAEALAAAARVVDDPVRVIVTLRDDFLLRTEEVAALRDRIGQGLQLLTVPAADDLVRILVEPARRAGYELEDAELPVEMVREVADQPGALALISFTAAKLWELRDRHFKQLTRAAYKTLGGVGGALARHAELTLEEMPADERALTREAFRHLVTSQNTRAVVERGELRQLLGGTPRAERVIENLVAARLVVASESDSGRVTIEIVHEALLITWPRLIEWHREDIEGARFREQLRAAAGQWDERGRPKGLLWRGDAVADYLRWRDKYRGELVDVEAAFANASVGETTRGRRIRATLIAVTMIVLATGMIVLLSLNASKDDERKKAADASALAQQRADESHRQLAEQYEEQGRSELVAGHAGPALLYLLAAVDTGADRDAAMNFMLAEATRPLRAVEHVLRGHTAGIEASSLTADGATLVTAGEDGTARVWRTKDGRLLATLDGKDGWLVDAQIDPMGRRVVTAGRNGTARLFTTAGQLVRELRSGDPQFVGFGWKTAISADGSVVAISDAASGVVRLFNAETGAPIQTIATAEPAVEIVAFSPNANRIVTSHDKRFQLWSIDGQPLGAGSHGAPISSLSFSRKGDRLVTTSWDRTARVWDGATARPIAVLQGHSDYIDHAAFSPDGNSVVTASRDKTARVWDPASGALRFTLVGHTGVVNRVEFDAAGRRIVTASLDGTASLWDADTGARLASFEGHWAPVQTASFVGDDHVVTTSLDGTARIWNAATGIRQLRGHTSTVQGVDVSRDGAQIVTAGEDRTARIWDAATGRPLAVLNGHSDAVIDVHFSPDGARVVTASADHTAKLWKDGKPQATLAQTGEAYVAAFTGDGTRVVVGSADGNVSFWDVATGQKIAASRAHLSTIWSITSDRNGHVVTSADDGAVIVWADDGRTLHRWSPSKAGVWATAISPDGATLVTGSVDGTCALWTMDGTLLHKLDGHRAQIFAVAFDETGRELVTSSVDGTARVWSSSGMPIAVLRGQGGALRAARFAAAGNLIVTAGIDGYVDVWDAGRGSQLARWSVHRGVIANLLLDPARRTVVTAGFDGAGSLRPLVVDDEATPALASLARCTVPFTLEKGRLISRVPSPCAE